MTHVPDRLIDPEGEGVYLHGTNVSLLTISWEFFGNSYCWRDLDYEGVWMREDEEGLWHRTRYRWWHGFLPSRWCPTFYGYWTPKPEAM